MPSSATKTTANQVRAMPITTRQKLVPATVYDFAAGPTNYVVAPY